MAEAIVHLYLISVWICICGFGVGMLVDFVAFNILWYSDNS